MKIKCPYCKAYNFLKLDKININHIHKSNIEIKDFLVGEVAQINNIIIFVKLIQLIQLIN